MIEVERISVNVRIPSDEVRIIAMQPFIMLDPEAREPFKWAGDLARMQLKAVHRTLDIAQADSADQHTNFTLFPEYSIPGVAGATAINNRITADEWPNESIIIAGVDGLTKNDFIKLRDEIAAQACESNEPESVPDNQWVNCCVIWIKDRDGIVQKWLQPKVRPAWPEMNVSCNDMYQGSKLYVFECQYEPSGYPCRFITMICYDWVASIAGQTVCNEFLLKFEKLMAPNPVQLDWVFVIQHNPAPNHQSFLNGTCQFLTDTNAHPFVERDKAVIVHSNTAVSKSPAHIGEGGFSACVFSPNVQFDCKSCRPSVCMQPKSLRKSDILERCKDIVFREMGECIHSFSVRVPRFITPDATDRTYPLPQACVHAVCESNDPRLSGGQIPASVKWISDSLDNMERLSAITLAGCNLKVTAEVIEPEIVSKIRVLNGHTACNFVNWAACSFSNGNISRNEFQYVNSDIWGEKEFGALKHILHSLTSIGLAYNLDFESALLHGAVIIDEGYVQVVAIHGETHQDCRLHYDKHISSQGPDPVLVIALDSHNLVPTPEEYLKLDETMGKNGMAFIDYQTLINNCRNAADSNTLKEYLDGIIPKYSRII